jgi:C-terminal processing protease CtpA/Prc
VNNRSLRHRRPVALLAAATLMAAAPIARVAADVPAAPAPPETARTEGSKDLDAQLDDARRRLEQAANEVARLSAQLSTTAIDRIMPLFEPGRSVIGVQLEPSREGSGARVREVSPGGPAETAGIRSGDVIVAVNGTALTDPDPGRQVLGIMHDVKPDSRVTVRVLRDGKAREFTLTAREAPALFATAHGLRDLGYAVLPDLQEVFMVHGPLSDMELATLTPHLGSYFGTDKGVLVVRAPAEGALKLEDGDVILAIDGREPTSGSHATRILGSYQPGEKVSLRILRQRKALQLEAQMPERPGPLRHEILRRQGSFRESLEPPSRKPLVIHGSGEI